MFLFSYSCYFESLYFNTVFTLFKVSLIFFVQCHRGGIQFYLFHQNDLFELQEHLLCHVLCIVRRAEEQYKKSKKRLTLYLETFLNNQE